MTDLDTFAAAALTGLLAAPTDKDRSMDYWARLAYEAADAMLRERERTNHDAVPAAKAEELESSVPLGSGSALANTSEPVAWVAFATDGSESSAVYSLREQAQAAADDWGWSFAPLYARLPLTDKEREALEAAIRIIDAHDEEMDGFPSGAATTLRAMLKRLTC
jgi:hypothetical protein